MADTTGVNADFINLGIIIEQAARNLQGHIGRGEGTPETDADYCRAHPIESMQNMLEYLRRKHPERVSAEQVDHFAAQCRAYLGKSLYDLSNEGDAVISDIREAVKTFQKLCANPR